MSATLDKAILQDDVAISVATVLAAANRKAKELGVDVHSSLITIAEHLSANGWLWRVNYGPREYIGRRGGDLIIAVDARTAKVEQILRGQ